MTTPAIYTCMGGANPLDGYNPPIFMEFEGKPEPRAPSFRRIVCKGCGLFLGPPPESPALLCGQIRRLTEEACVVGRDENLRELVQGRVPHFAAADKWCNNPRKLISTKTNNTNRINV